MKHIIFLSTGSGRLSREEEAAWTYLRQLKDVDATKILLSRLQKDLTRLRQCDAIWWHYDSSLQIPDALHSEVWEEALRSFIYRGGGLFLSLLAAPYVVDLGFEKRRPNIVSRGKWKEHSWAPEYPDMRGLAGCRGHRLFAEFRGGPFTWAPSIGDTYSAAMYEATSPADGRVIAVEKCYIRLHEHRRIALEYQIGRGTIVTVGTHLFFSNARDRFRPHLESLTSKILSYVSKPRTQKSLSGSNLRNEPQQSFWRIADRDIQPSELNSTPIRWKREPLHKVTGKLAVHRDLRAGDGGEEHFSLAGRRIVLLGKERGGLSEVWCHPARILKDLRVAFKVGHENSEWSHSLAPELTVQPESLTRRYELHGAVITETCFPDLTQAAGILSYHIESPKPLEFFLTTVIDLRLMWPLSEEASGSLRYHWDHASNTAIVTGDQGRISSVLCVSESPLDCQLAQSEPMALAGEPIVGNPTRKLQVAIGMRIALNPGGHDLHFVFAGSVEGLAEALTSVQTMSSNPSCSLRRRGRHFASLQYDSVQIETPDVQFNEGIRWALCSLDGTMVDTPGIGKSLVAGYGLSSAGWDGGHASSGRPGYAWYFGRDSVWSGLALLGVGNFESVRAVIEFLGNHQDPTGKILHEMTTSGFAHYDAADATPLFLILFGRYVKSTGDCAFARRHFTWVQRAMQYCFSTDTDGDHLIENTGVGHGWIEGGFLFPSHTEHYLASCWAEALKESAFLAGVAGQRESAVSWHRESRRVRTIIKKDFWNPKTGFYRFAKMHDRTYREDRTIFPTVGMYFGCADPGKSQFSLAAYSSDEFSTDWGVRTVSKKGKSFNPARYQSGSVWPLMTGWTSLAEYACDRPLQGFAHLQSNIALTKVFSAGHIEEVLHGEEFKPVGVCPDQAWSAAMVLLPVIDGLLGLRVDAISRAVSFRPSIPPWWDHLKVSNVHVGPGKFSFAMRRAASETVYTFGSDLTSALAIHFEPLFPDGTQITDIRINGRSFSVSSSRRKGPMRLTIPFQLKDSTTIAMRHTMGISFVCPTPHLKRGETSSGLRVIETLWRRNTYLLTLEGRSGSEYIFDIFDPSQRVTAIDGGILLARQGSHQAILVRFPPKHSKDAYVRKVIRVKV